MRPILLYDTTLRDGTQGENIHFSAADKAAIAKSLDRFGIHYIEGGWPGSNPKDRQFFEMAKEIRFENAKLTAFGSTRRPGIGPEDDDNLKALLESGTPVVAVFGKSWTLHVKEVMQNTPQENLAMIRDTTAYLSEAGREIIYDAEHFFDGYKDNPDYALETLFAAVEGGARRLVLCDTNGGTLPHEIEAVIHEVRYRLSEKCPIVSEDTFILGIHTHNDCGLAVANALAAVRAGATLVQGTINGYGERCGNADLVSLIPVLALKMHYPCVPVENLTRLKRLSRFVSEMANIVPLNSRPFVGRSAFAHKGGIHVSAVAKNPRAYEHIDPQLVGNQRRVLVSDLSGKSNIEYKAKELGIDLGGNGFDSRKIVSKIKEMEQEGYEFDAAEGSFRILVQKLTEQFRPLFELESFRVTIEKNRDAPCSAHATIKISVGGKQEITAAEGDGPVSALDNALRKALQTFFPEIDGMHLVDFKVRVIDGREGTASKVRVLIDSRDRDHIWSTIGVSKDIIEASWKALEDSFQYKLSAVSPANGSGVPYQGEKS
ncbi:MAG: citramalate synthase [Deltaproteobacteria bacterium]|nr:citramalate synthase [Deltaproteobacteria bacterium]MBW2042418.1 citramalate synthase [Deltaproteobacteria bacterium]